MTFAGFRVLAVSACVAVLGLMTAAVPRVLAQGALTPPPGPIEPCMKTLDQIAPSVPVAAVDFPLIISQPGSYYLTETVFFDDSLTSDAITITSDNVTLDMNGFSLIYASRGVTKSQQDGEARGFLPAGIRVFFDFGQFTPKGSDTGFFFGLSGIRVTNGSIVGFPGEGYSGDEGYAAVLENMHFRQNGNDGARLGPGGVIRNCTALLNGRDGILSREYSTLDGCTAGLNGFSGFCVGPGGTITNSNAYENLQNGIYGMGDSTRIRNCVATLNGQDGIRVVNDSVVEGCTANFNGTTGVGSGVRATVGRNRLESNTTMSNIKGVSVDSNGFGNLVVKNNSGGNVAGNYVVDTSRNAFAPVSTLGFVASPLRGGPTFTAGPWDNFELFEQN
ncbi:MAG: right-handed parallel beta-helix repeat-containing protein [Candidatus Sumerlaeia bacterium]|nr:right-handed parallel beta-helix repeat-containing protein [Candidatus Sumerlaeia bacterium]